jgi:hypothetical protein
MIYLFLHLVVTFICPALHFLSIDTYVPSENPVTRLMVHGDLKCHFPRH